MTDPGAAAAAVATAHRAHWSTVLAATVALTRDLDLAEDSVQEAYAQALETWERSGVPENPAGWLTTAARRRALDVMRRAQTLQRKLPLLVWDGAGDGVEDEDEDGDEDEHPGHRRIEDESVPVVLDERLRLIFLAAHPALAPTSRIVLTLRLVGGLSTEQIAAAFLVQTSTMAARLTRAKKRIRLSRIPCRVPPAEELDSRLVDVLDVLSVLLATGAGSGGAGPGPGGLRVAGRCARHRGAHARGAGGPAAGTHGTARPARPGPAAAGTRLHPHRRTRPSDRPGGAGSCAVGSRADRSCGPSRGRRARPGRARPLSAPGCDRGVRRRARAARGHRLARGGRALRRPAGPLAHGDRAARAGGRDLGGRRCGRGPRRPRAARRGARCAPSVPCHPR